MGARLLALVLLIGALAAVAWFVRPRAHIADRAAMYRAWMRRAVAAFLVPSAVALTLLDGWPALVAMPAAFVPMRGAVPGMAAAEVVIGALGGTMLGLVVAAWRARRGGRPIGRPGTLMPRSRAELPWGTAVAIVAGATEEPFFRLVLPLLVALATGSAVAGFLLSTLIFGALHRYQGWRGMLATTAFGAVMAWVYLASGALWLVVVLHALVDLNGLVLWPALRRTG